MHLLLLSLNINKLFNDNFQPCGLAPFSFWSEGTNLWESERSCLKLSAEPRVVASSSWVLIVVYLRTRINTHYFNPTELTSQKELFLVYLERFWKGWHNLMRGIFLPPPTNGIIILKQDFCPHCEISKLCEIILNTQKKILLISHICHVLMIGKI